MDFAQSGTLNEVSEVVRTPETRNLLQKLDEVLASGIADVDPAIGSASTFREIISSLQRARKLFGANLFFVVIFGALKSGKSTLTNALVEAEISPMGYGRDTTQRPCLILRGPEAKCSQFFLRRASRRTVSAEEAYPLEFNGVDVRGKAFDLVTDYLKGVADPDVFKQHIEVREFPFTPAELERKLATASDPEPLITVVWVTTGPFLENGICLIDMPGLDSVAHNSSADNIHDWVIDDADFFLFLQSSVAALNERTQQFLKRIHDSRKQQPMWALQNVMDARYWRDGEIRLREFEEQRKNALDKLQLVLKHEKDHQPNSQWFNLGLEWDGVAESNQEWRSRSLFAEFKTAVTQQLKNERGHIKERNCLDNLAVSIKGALGQLAAIRTAQQVVLTEFQRIEGLGKGALLDEINKLSFFTEERLTYLRKALGSDLDRQLGVLKSRVEEKQKNRCSRAREMKKAELESLLASHLDDLRAVAEETFAFEGEFQKTLDTPIRLDIEQANGDSALAVINGLWSQIETGDSLTSDLKRIAAPQLPKFVCDVDVAVGSLTNYPNYLSFLDAMAESKFNSDRVEAIIEDVTADFLAKATQRFDSWKLAVVEPFRNYDASRRDLLKAKAAAHVSALLSRKQPAKAAAETAIAKCSLLEQALADLQPYVDNAVAST